MGKVLKIDSSDNKKISLAILENGKSIKEIVVASKILKSQSLLLAIKKILKDNNLEISELSGVDVNVTAGSYTGIRVGAAIANTLGFLLNIPINGEKIGVFAKPSYNN